MQRTPSFAAPRGHPARIGEATARAAIEKSLETVDPFRTSPGWNRVNALLQQYAVQAFNGQATPEEVLQEVQSQIN